MAKGFAKGLVTGARRELSLQLQVQYTHLKRK